MDQAAPKLVLIGLRASGKTTAGRLAAQEQNTVFRDLDDDVAAALSAESPGAALRAAGERRFRETETECLRAALADDSVGVLALGGGAPTAPGAADLLRNAENTRIVYLRADAGTLAERLVRSGVDRPALRGGNHIEEVGQLLLERDGLYTELADEVIEVAGETVESLIQKLT